MKFLECTLLNRLVPTFFVVSDYAFLQMQSKTAEWWTPVPATLRLAPVTRGELFRQSTNRDDDSMGTANKNLNLKSMEHVLDDVRRIPNL